jgi:hypothetical protein
VANIDVNNARERTQPGSNRLSINLCRILDGADNVAFGSAAA